MSNPDLKYLGFMPDKKWPHFLWVLTIGDERFEYKTGIGHATTHYNKQNRRNVKPENSFPDPSSFRWIHKPSVDSVLHCLFSDARCGEMSFDDFCSDFGYSNDSLSALDIYRKCAESGKKLKKALGSKFNEERERIEALEL